MYGNVPTSVAAGLPGSLTAAAIGWQDHLMWLAWTVLLVVTLTALASTLLRLVPRRGA